MRYRKLRYLASLLFVVLLAELGVRAISPRLDDPAEYYVDYAQRMVAEMEQLAELNQRSDLLFIGNSMVQLGVDVAPFEATLDDVSAAHKVALPGAQTPLVERWLVDEAYPRLTPRRVVWGVSSLDFNANRPEPMLETYLAARAVRQGTLGVIDRFAANHSYLIRHRDQLRDPIGVLRDLLTSEAAEPELAPSEYLSETPTPVAGRTPFVLQQIESVALSDFVVGHAETAAFRRTVEYLETRGVEVVIVVMPTPPDYRAAHPNGSADYESFRDTIMAESSHLGLTLFDYSDGFSTASFADYTHLTQPEAVRFSQQLAADLSGLGW